MISILLFSLFIKADQLRVAVIDQDFSRDLIRDIKLCDGGPVKSFNPKLTPFNPHGTSVAGLIHKYAGNADFCFILIDGLYSLSTSIESIKYAIKLKADVINYSGGGKDYSHAEFNAINAFVKTGGKFFAAAGNERTNLDKTCKYYPACFNLKITVVSNNEAYSNQYSKALVSNLDGSNESIYGIRLHGTSQSTAIETGRYIKSCKKKK